MLLDNKTLLFSLMLVSALMALSLGAVSREGERIGLAKWACALALESLVWLLVGERGVLPNIFSILLANVLMAAVQALKLAAIHEYRRKSIPYLQCLLPIVLTCGLFAYLQYDDIRHRLIFSSMIFGSQMLMILQALRQDTESRAGNAWWLLAGATTLMLPLLALRAIAAWLGPFEFATPTSTIAPNPAQLAIFIGVIALDLLGSMGFILMIKERGDREIRALAMTDSLTRVLNRRAFMERTAQEIAMTHRQKLPLSLLMLDIDYFKRINDEYGHPAGDAVLVKVAELITSQLRKQDMLGRYGGEEFCVLLPATDARGAFVLAEKLRAAVAATPFVVGKHSIALTLSLGVASHESTETTPPLDYKTLIEHADRALYQAKSSGRNRTIPLALEYELTAQPG